jgi:hypothetical protein
LECRHLDGDRANAALFDKEGEQRLVWGTRSENHADKALHAAQRKYQTLDEIQLAQIQYELRAIQRDMQQRYGLTQSTLQHIWSSLPRWPCGD